MRPAEPPPAIRRRPDQARSKLLVETVLGAARELLIDDGAERLTMTALADRSGIGVTAIYRYFPNRDAVLRELALRTFSADARLTEVPDLAAADVAEFVRSRIEEYWRLYQNEPFRVPLRTAIYADPALESLDRADTRRVAGEMARAAAQSVGLDPIILERRLVVTLESMQAVFRLAAHADDDAEATQIITTFIDMTVAALAPGAVPSEEARPHD